jgi:hypothetical protein
VKVIGVESHERGKHLPMNIMYRKPMGSMRPPLRKHSIHKAKAKPPHAPTKYRVPFQKKMVKAPK